MSVETRSRHRAVTHTHTHTAIRPRVPAFLQRAAPAPTHSAGGQTAATFGESEGLLLFITHSCEQITSSAASPEMLLMKGFMGSFHEGLLRFTQKRKPESLRGNVRPRRTNPLVEAYLASVINTTWKRLQGQRHLSGGEENRSTVSMLSLLS